MNFIKQRIKTVLLTILLGCLVISCNQGQKQEGNSLLFSENVLDYAGTPFTPGYRQSLAFSDQGAWFAYGFHNDEEINPGFSGPFLMTQQNGIWSSSSISSLELRNNANGLVYWFDRGERKSYNSHLWQSFDNDDIGIEQTLFFSSGHTAVINTSITNTALEKLTLSISWKGKLFNTGLRFAEWPQGVQVSSEKSEATGYIRFFDDFKVEVLSDSAYLVKLDEIELGMGESINFMIAHTFIFPDSETLDEKETLLINEDDFIGALQLRKDEKSRELNLLFQKERNFPDDALSKLVLSKAVLTLQNNWRIPAGELKHSGLFPSYHYVWFHGFWAWDSWKHAVALAQYNIPLAKQQVKAMYDFMDKDGFIADCVYRDTTIEAHNFRNTKPPLSAWAVWEIFKQDPDKEFLEMMYPKIVNQHLWWYSNRDHDNDGLCEYGSTDGTLIAAKWESGMDNAVRFDESQLLKNSEKSWSLNQESVDLNAYLYAEKKYLEKIANELNFLKEAKLYADEAAGLKTNIQEQFYDEKTGWFYDTSIDGKQLIKAMGCEGWIPLWAGIATPEQAAAVKNNMLNTTKFFTKVPFQTLSADHPKFKPDGGYWRGPTWLDQAYFGVKGLRNYGFDNEADAATLKLLKNAEGVSVPGRSIRENYNPITGKGLEAENFSWSAAHYLLLLINE